MSESQNMRRYMELTEDVEASDDQKAAAALEHIDEAYTILRNLREYRHMAKRLRKVYDEIEEYINTEI